MKYSSSLIRLPDSVPAFINRNKIIVLTPVFLFLICFLQSCFIADDDPALPPEPVTFPYRYISNVKIWEIRDLFRKKNFSELNRIMQKAQEDFEKDFRDEFRMADTYNSFDFEDEGYENNFIEWARLYPDLWQPYLARANYYHGMGWKSRGSAYAGETSGEQFAAMAYYFKLSLNDIKKSLGLNNKLMFCYGLLINIFKNEGEDTEKFLRSGLQICPESYYLREIYMSDLYPRWGGSRKKMLEFAREAGKRGIKNPMLKVLTGYVYYDKARSAEEDENYFKALDYYSKALMFGECWNFLDRRARLYFYDIKDNVKALADVERAIQINPSAYESYILKARILFRQRRIWEALEYFSIIDRLCTDKKKSADLKETASGHFLSEGSRTYKDDPKTSVKYLDKAQELFPENPRVYYWRGAAYGRLGDDFRAMTDIKTAITLDKEYFDAYRYLDWLLAKQRRWDDIINYWNIYISLKPEDARAYNERSGTFYHKGDFISAYKDALKACEMGDKEACGNAEKIKKAGNL